MAARLTPSLSPPPASEAVDLPRPHAVLPPPPETPPAESTSDLVKGAMLVRRVLGVYIDFSDIFLDPRAVSPERRREFQDELSFALFGRRPSSDHSTRSGELRDLPKVLDAEREAQTQLGEEETRAWKAHISDMSRRIEAVFDQLISEQTQQAEFELQLFDLLNGCVESLDEEREDPQEPLHGRGARRSGTPRPSPQDGGEPAPARKPPVRPAE